MEFLLVGEEDDINSGKDLNHCQWLTLPTLELTIKDHGMFIYCSHLLLKIFQQNQFQPLFSFYKYTFSFSLKGIYIFIELLIYFYYNF